jgi:hypothetical protein
LSFEAPVEVIEAWLQSSEGIAEARAANRVSCVGPRGESGACVIVGYVIAPGGGANFAEVTVDRSTGTGRIRTYWS